MWFRSFVRSFALTRFFAFRCTRTYSSRVVRSPFLLACFACFCLLVLFFCCVFRLVFVCSVLVGSLVVRFLFFCLGLSFFYWSFFMFFRVSCVLCFCVCWYMSGRVIDRLSPFGANLLVVGRVPSAGKRRAPGGAREALGGVPWAAFRVRPS